MIWYHRGMDYSKIRKIAVVRRNGLGDLLCAIPLVHHCRDLMPQAEVTLFVDQRCAPLLPYLQGFDKAVVFERKWNRYVGALWTCCKHRKEKFDLVISAKTVPMKLMNLILWTLNGKQRLAVVDDRWHSKLINQKISPTIVDDFNVHQAAVSLRLLSPEINEVPEAYYPRLVLPVDVKMACVDRVMQFKQQGIGPLLLISVTNNRDASFLGLDGYRTLLNALYKRLSYRVIISCEEKDLPAAEILAKQLEMPALPIATKTVDEFLHLLNAVDAVFVGDGGIMHMTAALGKKLLVLFGATRLEQWRPLHREALSLHHPENVRSIPTSVVLDALCGLLA
jgi:ADP-heptose:LPS heptosyltransferase